MIELDDSDLAPCTLIVHFTDRTETWGKAPRSACEAMQRQLEAAPPVGYRGVTITEVEPGAYQAKKDNRCPASKPWGVTKATDGALMGCHPTEDAAMEQVQALYANEPGNA